MAWITTQQAAEVLKLTPQWVSTLCKRGVLYAIKPGRDWQVDDSSVFGYKEKMDRGEIKRGVKGKELTNEQEASLGNTWG